MINIMVTTMVMVMVMIIMMVMMTMIMTIVNFMWHTIKVFNSGWVDLFNHNKPYCFLYVPPTQKLPNGVIGTIYGWEQMKITSFLCWIFSAAKDHISKSWRQLPCSSRGGEFGSQKISAELHICRVWAFLALQWGIQILRCTGAEEGPLLFTGDLQLNAQKYTWFLKILNNRMVLPGDPSVLQLHGVTREDSGEYICQVLSSCTTCKPHFNKTLIIFFGGHFSDSFDFRQEIVSAIRKCLSMWQSILK